MNTATYARFGIDAKQATSALRLSPQDRLSILVRIGRIFTGRKVVGTPYRANNSSTLFLGATDVNFTPNLLLDGGIRASGEKTLQANLRRYGFYKRSDAFPVGTPVRIAVLNAIRSPLVDQFLPHLQEELRAFQFASTISQVESVRGTSRDELEKAVHRLQTSAPHVQLALFPDGGEDEGENESAWGPYHHFKSLTSISCRLLITTLAVACPGKERLLRLWLPKENTLRTISREELEQKLDRREDFRFQESQAAHC